MRPTLATPFLFHVLFVAGFAMTGCSAEAEAEQQQQQLESQESAQTSSNCSFIPGCKDLLEAADGPFSASLMTYEDATGATHQRLSVSYRERHDSSFLLCQLFPTQPTVSAVFVIGPQGARTSISRPMSVSCPTSYGDNSGQSNHATFSVAMDEDPELWNTLFPLHNGARWYALQVAAMNAHGDWDSRYGNDYRLVLEPR